MLLWEGEADGALVGMEHDFNTDQEGQNNSLIPLRVCVSWVASILQWFC